MKLPKHSQLTLPLLNALSNQGRTAKDTAAILASELSLPDVVTHSEQERPDRGTVNLWERRVRWVRQTLVGAGMIANDRRNWWELTAKGRAFLVNCRPGVIITVFETENGMALWAEAETAVAYLQDEAIDLLITSPEYPLNKSKHYGNRKGNYYLDWLCDLAAAWKPKLRNTGSLILNLQDVYLPGMPALNLYQERLLVRLVDDLGYHLCQKFIASSDSKIPATDWVTVKRVRVKSGFETFYWFGKNSQPKASNLRVLAPYGPTMLRKLARGGDARAIRPSGHGHLTPSFARNNGGSIPSNVIRSHNANASDGYMRGCRADGIDIHPARMPDEPVDFLVRLLTDVGDVVYDPLAGSLKVGEVAERHGRKWLASEKSLVYLYGGRHRFSGGQWLGPVPTELTR